MKTLIISISTHHGNTLKVAKVMTEVLGADMAEPQSIEPAVLAAYDLIGFGSGIYNHKHHQALFDLAEKMPAQNGKKAFVFSTNTFGLNMLHETLKNKLAEKGYETVGEFACPGFIDYGLTKYIFGGISKGRPNDEDLKKAREFATKFIG